MSAQHGNNKHWPADEEAKIRKLWDEGLSGSEIARKLPGRSREAVLGKARRLGLKDRDGPANFQSQTAVTIASRKAKAPEVKRSLQAGAINARKGRPAPPKPADQNPFGSAQTPAQAEKARAKAAVVGAATISRFTTPANDDAIPLLSRRPFQCSWPVGTPDRPANQMCCGQPVPEGGNRATPTYCPDHAARALSAKQSPLTPTQDRRHNPLMQSRGRIMADTLWNGGRAA